MFEENGIIESERIIVFFCFIFGKKKYCDKLYLIYNLFRYFGKEQSNYFY